MTMMMKKPMVAQRTVLVNLFSGNEWLEIYETEHSGKVITREKIDTITGVSHPGIVLGDDKYGRSWIAHNHYKNKRPAVDLLEKFCLSENWQWDNRSVYYSRIDIVNRAVEELNKGKEYKFANYNCQTYVNLVVRNEHSSEAVDKVTDYAMFSGALIALFGVLTKNKALVATGLTVAGAAGAGKIYSKTR